MTWSVTCRTKAHHRFLVISIILAFVSVTLSVASEASDNQKAAQTKLEETYRLADGENAKLIAPPFIAERIAFHTVTQPQIANFPGQYGFRWKAGHLKQRFWSTDPGTVASAMQMADIDEADLDGVRDLFEVKVPGDWIVRDGAKREALLADIQKALTKATNGKIRIEPTKIEKEVIVARGRFALKPLPNVPRQQGDIHLYTDSLDPQEGAGGGTASLDGFLRRLGEVAGQKVINETELYKKDVSWANNHSANDASGSPAKRDLLLKNVTTQTGLEFKIEKRKVPVWRIIDTTGNAGGL